MKPSAGWRKEAALCLGLFAVALLVRVVTVLYANHAFSHYVFAPDSRLYDALARSLAAGTGYAIDGNYREYTRVAPGFPVYLAAVYRLFGSTSLIVGLANAVVGSLTCVAVYAIGRKLLSRWAAMTAALVTVVYWEFLVWTPFVLKETIGLLLFMAALLLTLEARARASWPMGLAAGVTFGMAGLTRYPHLLFLPFLVVVFVVASDRRRTSRVVLALVAGVVVAMAPWLVRNYLVFGELLLSNHGPARALYLVHAPGKVEDTRGYAGLEGVDMRSIDDREQQTASIKAREGRHWSAFVTELATNPGRLVQLVVAKIVNMWRPTWQKFPYLIGLAFTVEYAVILALGLVGLALAARANPHWALLHVVLLYYVLVHAVWWGEIRNRMYVMPYLVLFAGYTVQAAAAWWAGMRHAGRAPTLRRHART